MKSILRFKGILLCVIFFMVFGCTFAWKQSYEAAKNFAAKGNYYNAALSAIDALEQKPDFVEAKTLLREVGPKAYQERLAYAQDIEKTNRAQAIAEYQEIQKLVLKMKRYDVHFPVIDFEAKIADLKAADASQAYTEGEQLFDKGRYDEAIAAYQRAINILPNYKNSTEKIAECYYRLADISVKNKNYRRAAELYKNAESYRPNYKDCKALAAKIYFSLGNYFLNHGNPRKAVLDFQETEKLIPNYPGLAPKLQTAMLAAAERIAVVGIENKTGRNIEGMSVEDFIADSIFDKLQRKKSQFLEMYTRTQLETVMAELRLGTSGLIELKTAEEIGKLKGVRYLVSGKISQVSQKKEGPNRFPRQTSYKVDLYQPVTEYDRKGRPYQTQRYVGTTTRYVTYEEIQWSAEIAFAGSVNVLDVKTGKIIVNRNFEKRETANGQWAENLSDPTVTQQLSREVQALLNAPRSMESTDAMAKRAIDGHTEELVNAILAVIDITPSVIDPTGELR